MTLTLLPLTPMQQRMWHLCTAYEGSGSPIVAMTHRIRGPLDVERFTHVVARVVDRHDSLRTRFPVVDGKPWQEVGPTGTFEVELVQGDAKSHVVQLSEALLDLERGPLVRSRLIKVDDDDHVWCFAAHHLLADGASAGIIEGEVAALYSPTTAASTAALHSPAAGRPGPLRGRPYPRDRRTAALHNPAAAGPGPLRGRPHPRDRRTAAPERSYSAALDQHESDLEWWVDRLRDVPALDLVPNRPAVKVASSAHFDHRIGADLTGALESLARKQRATLFMVLFAGYSSMLKNLSGQSDFCIGVPVEDPERENAVGLFANMVALRCDLSGDPDFAETVKRTRSLTIEALSRQNVPFGQIVERLNLVKDPSRTQVFQTIFSVHTETARAFVLPGVSIEPFGAGSPSILHDLVLDVWRNPAGLDLTFRYDTALLPTGSVAGLARQYEAVLEAAL